MSFSHLYIFSFAGEAVDGEDGSDDGYDGDEDKESHVAQIQDAAREGRVVVL
jgi:hypothetical protein